MSIESGWCGLLCCLQLRRLRSTSARPDHPTVEADPTSRHGTSPRSHFGRSPMPGGGEQHQRAGFSQCKERNQQQIALFLSDQSDQSGIAGNWRVIVNGCKFNKVSYFLPVFSPYLTQMML